MKKNLLITLAWVAVMTQSSLSFADIIIQGQNISRYGYGHGYGHGHYGDGQYGNGDAAFAIFAGVSATLLSLSALDSADRYRHIAMIKQAETEALAFNDTSAPSTVFMDAKVRIEGLQGKALSNQEAAIMIVELNQEFRQE